MSVVDILSHSVSELIHICMTNVMVVIDMLNCLIILLMKAAA